MKRTVEFLKPRMVGERFSENSIPFEMLKDLSVLEEMILEVAKWLYLQDNESRKRTPRGFTDGVSLQLADVGEGSAVPAISLSVAGNDMFPQNLPYFEQARDAIISAIDAAANSENIHQYLPGSLLGFFDRFGRSLLDGESIEFRPDAIERKAKFDRIVRKRLILGSQVQVLTDDVTLRGIVPEVDQEKMTFTIAIANGNRISAPISVQHMPLIMDAFERYKDGARISLQGVGRFNRSGKLELIESIEHIVSIETNDVFYRIDELRTLQNGWLDGLGLAPKKDFLDWLSNQFEKNYQKDLPWPYLFPTPEGGILLEWDLEENEISLDIDPGSKIAFYHKLNMNDYSDDSTNIEISNSDGWLELNKRLLVLRGDANEE